MRWWIGAALLLVIATTLHAWLSPAHALEPRGREAHGILAAPHGPAVEAEVLRLAAGAPQAAAADQPEEDQGPDILLLSLVTMAAVLGSGVVGLILYLVRQRIGFWLHRPPPREGGGESEHH